MARDEAPPFARGETWYNGGTIDPTDNTTLGGVNIEGKEYVFEVNAQDQSTGFPTNQDISGRPVRVKVARNTSGVNLKGARLAHFQAASTASSPYETRVDGYCTAVGDRPAGVIDEYLPPAGVVPNDLFYLVIDGPSQVTNVTGAVTFNVGDTLVPATLGATRGDDLGGRVAEQVVTGATAALANNISNIVGYADAFIAATTGTIFNAVVHLRGLK
jgi:hypothetical protein